MGDAGGEGVVRPDEAIIAGVGLLILASLILAYVKGMGRED
jgi:hypothetical protein